MRNVFARGAAAGALAGLVSGVVSYLLVEPTVDRAIALEGAGDGPVSRHVQKVYGLTSGAVLGGIALGLLFALAFRVLPSKRSAWDKSVGLGVGGFAALILIPQLRYPSNPPGVGDSSTIAERTSGYLFAVALGVAVVCAAYYALRRLAARGVPPNVRQPAVLGASVLVIGLGYLALPSVAVTYDLPANLLWQYRVQSLGIQLLLLTGLTVTFGVFAERVTRTPSAPDSPARLLV